MNRERKYILRIWIIDFENGIVLICVGKVNLKLYGDGF